jgi:hypothetical protein
LEDLAGLAAEIYARSLRDEQDDGDSQLSFEDRKVRVETTFGGAGVVTGDLTPECSAVVTAVLDALSAPIGAEDTRTREQRYHDALEDAMRPLRFCVMLDSRTPCRQTGRKPSSGRRVRPPERDLRRGRVDTDPARAQHASPDPARLDRRGYLQR